MLHLLLDSALYDFAYICLAICLANANILNILVIFVLIYRQNP